MKEIILITGASSGIGFEALRLLVQHGYVVYGTARKNEDLEAIESEGGHALKMEMTDYSTLTKSVETVRCTA